MGQGDTYELEITALTPKPILKNPPNAKKNYKKGPRRKVAQLMLYCGLLPFKALTLLDGNYKTLCKKIDEMRSTDEGVLEKRKECGLWMIGFKTYAYDTACKPLMLDNFDIQLCDFYERNGKRYWKKARSKCETDVYRVVRNAETIMFMDRLPVKYMLGDKPILESDSPLEHNVFYTPNELNLATTDYATVNQTYKFQGSRFNGFLATNGGNYTVYNTSDWTLQIESGYEVRLHSYIDSMLAQKKSDLYSAPLMLYRNPRVFEDLIDPKYKRQSEWIENLEQPYGNVYAVPLEQTGQKMANMMCSKDWQELLRSMLLPKNIMHPNLPYIVHDGVIPYKNTATNEVIERIVFLFCIPDIKRLRKFIAAAKATGDKEKFEIRCYDYQAETIKKIVGEYAYVNVTPFEMVYEKFQEIAQKDNADT